MLEKPIDYYGFLLIFFFVTLKNDRGIMYTFFRD